MGKDKQWVAVVILAFLTLLGAGLTSTVMGKALGGTVTEVRSAEVIVVVTGTGQDVLRIVGITGPQDASLATKAKQLLTEMVMGKVVRARFQS